MNLQEEYEQMAQAKLNELKAEIEKLQAKAEGAGANAKIKYQKEIEKLSSTVESTLKSVISNFNHK